MVRAINVHKERFDCITLSLCRGPKYLSRCLLFVMTQILDTGKGVGRLPNKTLQSNEHG